MLTIQQTRFANKESTSASDNLFLAAHPAASRYVIAVAVTNAVQEFACIDQDMNRRFIPQPQTVAFGVGTADTVISDTCVSD